MSELAVAVLLATGVATHYGEGIMEPVVQNREYWQQIVTGQGEVGYVAMLDREHIGRMVWLEHPNGTVVGPALVVDCAGEVHRERLVQLGWAVDLSYQLAQLFDSVGTPVKGMKVWDAPPVGRDRWLVGEE